MRLKRAITIHIAGVLAMLMLAVYTIGCASTGQPQATVAPDTRIAHYSGTVLNAATMLQRGITSATDTGGLPIPMAQQITGYVQQIYNKSVPLETALKAYHAATTTGPRSLAGADIQKIVADINGLIGQILGSKMPEGGTATQIIALVGNVIAAVGSVQSEIAAVLK